MGSFPWQVFDDLGKDVLEAAFEGFNTCVFAYGQTGAGKSYSITGTPDEPGLIPRVCEGLFERIQESTIEGAQYKANVT